MKNFNVDEKYKFAKLFWILQQTQCRYALSIHALFFAFEKSNQALKYFQIVNKKMLTDIEQDQSDGTVISGSLNWFRVQVVRTPQNAIHYAKMSLKWKIKDHPF